MKRIIQYIISTILALSIITLTIVNIFSSTILNKEYILSKLQEQNYYDKIYEEVESNFENYIHQSGLDEEVLEGIVTKKKIQDDTTIIINNIYDGIDEKISTEEIRNNLKEKINNSIEGKISTSQQQSIDTFIDTICNEYETTISHTNYEKKINSIINKLNKYLSLTKKGLTIIMIISVISLILLTLKNIYEMVSKIGIAFVIDGLILILSEKYICSKIKIDTIIILNKGISDVLQSILKEILANILKSGSIMLGLGISLVIIYGIIKSICKVRREKEQYTIEN